MVEFQNVFNVQQNVYEKEQKLLTKFAAIPVGQTIRFKNADIPFSAYMLSSKFGYLVLVINMKTKQRYLIQFMPNNLGQNGQTLYTSHYVTM